MQGLMLPHIGQVWLMPIPHSWFLIGAWNLGVVNALPIGRGWVSADETILDGTVLEQHSRGYAHYIVLHRQLLVIVHVILTNLTLPSYSSDNASIVGAIMLQVRPVR